MPAIPKPHASARLHLPGRALAGCIHLAAERDTRGLALSDAQRFNFYPASPFPTIWWVFEGELRMVENLAEGAAPRLSAPVPRVVAAGAHRAPTVSWAPGPVHALVVSFYPDAWRRLLGMPLGDCRDALGPLDALPPSAARDALACLGADGVGQPGSAFAQVQAVLEPLWAGAAGPAGARNLRTWLRAQAVRAAFTPPGAGMRQAQRRLRDWTGQSQRELQLFTRVEQAFALSSKGSALADVAHDAGYSDQSHLGREIKRVTGLPPGRFAQRLRADEAFWLYRLLEGHLR